jgi:hypothetical protein
MFRVFAMNGRVVIPEWTPATGMGDRDGRRQTKEDHRGATAME